MTDPALGKIDKKRHHFVPATYLRRFVDDEGFLNVVRKAEPKINLRSKPTETGFRKFYYSQPVPNGSQDNNALEDVFSRLEAAWPHTAQSIEMMQSSNSVLSNLLAFIGLQRVRVPAFRDAIEHAMARFAYKKYDDLRLAGALPPPPPEFPDLMDQLAVTIDPHQSIHAMAILMRQLGPILDTLGYSVIHNETNVDFITSDNPVSYFTSSQRTADAAPYHLIPHRRWELLFPISPRTAIFGSTSDQTRFRKYGLRHLRMREAARVRGFNETTARFAYEVYFSRTALAASFVAKFANRSPVLSPEFPGFGPDGLKMPTFVFGERQRLLKYRP